MYEWTQEEINLTTIIFMIYTKTHSIVKAIFFVIMQIVRNEMILRHKKQAFWMNEYTLGSIGVYWSEWCLKLCEHVYI